jgi:hypothetical protein
MLSILRHGAGSPRAEGAQDEERIAPSEARRANRRVGADRASLRLAGAARIRAHPSAGAVRRGPASGRAEETSAASKSTLQRKVARFEAEGMVSLTLEYDGEPLSRCECGWRPPGS